MKTTVVRADSAGAVDSALSVLKAGGLVAFPTDTVYGLGAMAFDDHAVRSLYPVKDRQLEKAIPVLLADPDDLDLVAEKVPDLARRLAELFWPGPLTLVVPKVRTLPESVSATGAVGVRIPDLALARAILRAAGPLAVTSANRSGQESPTSAENVLRELRGRIPLILDGGSTPGGVPSTVVDCTKGDLVIVRVGPLSEKDLRLALKQTGSNERPKGG